MLDELIQFARTQVGDQIKNENGLDDNQKDQVFQAAQGGLMDTIKSQIGGGNIGGILNLFNGEDDPDNDKNPVKGQTQQNVVTSLMDKLGLDEGKAGAIANQVVPLLIKQFASKDTGTASDAGDLVKKIGLDGDNNIMDIVSKFTKGGSGGLMDTVKGLFDGK